MARKKVEQQTDRQWIKSTEDILGRMLLVTIGNEQIAISLENFSAEDVDRLAFQGLLIKIQRATAGKKGRHDKEVAALRKARELADGKLTSDRTSVMKSVTAKVIARMRDAGFSDAQIREIFPEWDG